MDARPIDAIVNDELRRAGEEAGTARRRSRWSTSPRIRERLLGFGWVKDARVSRRLPDTLVIDIVERKPAALWQNQGRLALIDAEGVVLDRVPVDKMPDLPLLIGPGANGQAEELDRLMAEVPTLEAAAGLGDLGRRPALGPQLPVRRDGRSSRGRGRRARRAHQLRQARQVDRPARPRHRSASTCAFPAR